MNSTLETRPLPIVAWLMFAAARLESVYVYRFHDDRWYLSAEDGEYMLIDLPEGLKLVDNPF